MTFRVRTLICLFSLLTTSKKWLKLTVCFHCQQFSILNTISYSITQFANILGPTFRLRSTLLGSQMRFSFVFLSFLSIAEYTGYTSSLPLCYLAFLPSWRCYWWRTPLITTVYFFLLQTPVNSAAGLSCLDVFGGYFCSILAWLSHQNGARNQSRCVVRKHFHSIWTVHGKKVADLHSPNVQGYSFLVF